MSYDRGHAKNVPMLGIVSGFQRRTVVRLLTPKFTEAIKNQLLEKSDPLTEKFQNLMFLRRYIQKCLPDSLQYQHEACTLLTDNKKPVQRARKTT